MEFTGTVANGVVVLDNGNSLPDGTRVRVTQLEPQPERLRDVLLQFAGTAMGLPPDMAENHDHYLHGMPKK
jgi:hypothetical protein